MLLYYKLELNVGLAFISIDMMFVLEFTKLCAYGFPNHFRYQDKRGEGLIGSPSDTLLVVFILGPYFLFSALTIFTIELHTW